MPKSSKKTRTPDVEMLLETLCSIDDTNLMFRLLEDLCTPRELVEIAQRLRVAQMLQAGENYARIQRATGASATTIARVSKSLNYGTDGYHEVLETVLKESKA